jgi:predicted TIM-barrel fold metal-dependent hydrolase
MELMRSRKKVPFTFQTVNPQTQQTEERLVILPGEAEEDSTSRGRVISEDYWSADAKLKQMNTFNIQTSVLSVANPWIDFLETDEEQIEWAKILNDELNDIAKSHPGRFYGFGLLPLRNVKACVAELKRISSLEYMRGVIMSTSGCGKGLDDPDLLPLYAQAAESDLMIFIHPHYGIGNESFGGYGHTLYLALGFPFETTTAIARLVLSGVLEKIPSLKLLLAHSGGTLPFLAGRIDSCAKHDEKYQASKILSKPPSAYLKQLYYDCIAYHSPGLNCAIEFVGSDRLMFGTDHPFSISDPQTLYESMSHLPVETQNAIRSDNARRILRIPK